MSLLGDLATLSKRAGFTKLLGVRLVSQVGDGMFQAGLASLFFFSPQSMAEPGGVASALVVLLLPYSLIGPFTGPFLDRWRRRQVLFYGNLVRCALVAVIAAVMALLGVGPAVGALALCTLGLARFLLSALSAGLPKVVGGNERLVMANSVVPTLGGIAMGLGAVIGVLMRVLLPESASREISSLVAAALLYLGAALAALLLAPGELGPDGVERPAPLGETLRRTAGELGAAVTYLLSRGTPAAALVTMALHRFVYYMELITIILAARNLLSEPSDADAGIALFGTLGGAMVAGHFLAVILTPVAHERMAPSRWTLVCLVVGTVGQLAVAVSYSTPVFIALRDRRPGCEDRGRLHHPGRRRRRLPRPHLRDLRRHVQHVGVSRRGRGAPRPARRRLVVDRSGGLGRLRLGDSLRILEERARSRRRAAPGRTDRCGLTGRPLRADRPTALPGRSGAHAPELFGYSRSSVRRGVSRGGCAPGPSPPGTT